MDGSGTSQVSQPQTASPVQPAPLEQPIAPSPISDVAPVAPAEVKHTSYVNTADMVNWRGIMMLAAIGLVVALLVGSGIYFGVSALNNGKLSDQQTQLDSIQKELTALKETPTPLELPASTTPTPTTQTQTPVVSPTTTPTETPVTTPATLPANTTEGTTAAG